MAKTQKKATKKTGAVSTLAAMRKAEGGLDNRDAAICAIADAVLELAGEELVQDGSEGDAPKSGTGTGEPTTDGTA